MTRYLLVQAASFHLLVDATLVHSVGAAAMADHIDLSRALGGNAAAVFITLAGTRQLGVDAVPGLLDLAETDLSPLPAPIAAAAGEDIDAVTRMPHHGAHAFRLRLEQDRGEQNVPIR